MDETAYNEDYSLSSEQRAFFECMSSRYQLKAKLGQGGMGAVFHASDKQLQRDVAIKVQQNQSNDSVLNDRFIRETRALAALNHPNIVKILNSGISKNNVPFYVMEMLSGQPLSLWLQNKQQALSGDFFQIMIEISSALEHIHANELVHRDLKPSNIMICAGETRARAIIIDFGIVRQTTSGEAGNASLTLTNTALGSPSYMSPEQCRGGKIDQLSDIYSLACIMYEFIAGNPPLQGATAAETMYRHLNEPAAKLGFANQTIATEKLASLIASGLERDAKLRPQSAAIVTENLKQIYALLGDKTELALGQARSPKRLKRTVVLALALGIPFIAIAAFYFNRVVPPQSNGTTCNGRTLATTLQNGSSKSSSDTTLMQGNKALRIEVANQEKRIRRMSLAGQISELEQDSDLLGVHGVPSGDIRRLAAIIVAHEVIADCRKRNKRNELFAALNLLNNLQLNVNENIETRITTLRSALALFPDHTVEANFCLASLADLYLQIKNLDAAEACAKRIDIHSKPQIISNALWRPSGSSPEVRQNVLLGHIACLRNDYAGSLPYFARAEQLERDEEEFSQLAMLIHDKTAHFWRMGKKKEAREILTRFEKEVSAIAPENYDKVHLDIVFAIMKDTAKALHDDALLQKTEDDSKTMAIRAKRPTTDEQVFNKALQGWR